MQFQTRRLAALQFILLKEPAATYTREGAVFVEIETVFDVQQEIE